MKYLIIAIMLSGVTFSQDFRLSGHSGNINCVVFSPDSKTMVSADENGKIIFRNTGDFTNTYEFSAGSNATGLAFSPNGSELAAILYEGAVNIINPLTKEIKRNFRIQGNCYSAVYSKDGRYLAITFTQIKEVKDKNGGVIEQLADYIDLYETSAYNFYKRLKTGTSDLSIGSIFGTNIFKSYLSNSFNCDFSENGIYLASGGNSKKIRVFSFDYGKFIPAFKGHSDKIYCVRFSSDGSYLASGGRDETVKIWDIKSAGSIKTLKGHSGDVNCVSFSPDSKYLASGGDDETVRLWDPGTTKQLKVLDGFNFDILTVNFSPDGSFLAAAGEFDNILVWRTKNILP